MGLSFRTKFIFLRCEINTTSSLINLPFFRRLQPLNSAPRDSAVSVGTARSRMNTSCLHRRWREGTGKVRSYRRSFPPASLILLHKPVHAAAYRTVRVITINTNASPTLNWRDSRTKISASGTGPAARTIWRLAFDCPNSFWMRAFERAGPTGPA